MNQKTNIDRNVLEILKMCHHARNDDMILVCHYYNRYGNIPVGKLNFENVMFNYKVYGLPNFASIRRSRQRVQALFPEYSREAEETDDDMTLIITFGGE